MRERLRKQEMLVVEMLSLEEMVQMTSEDLDRASMFAKNRQYSLSLSRMAEARRALVQQNPKLAQQFVNASRMAWLRAHEDEAGQLRRIKVTERVVREKGVALNAEKGKNAAEGGKFSLIGFDWRDRGYEKE